MSVLYGQSQRRNVVNGKGPYPRRTPTAKPRVRSAGRTSSTARFSKRRATPAKVKETCQCCVSRCMDNSHQLRDKTVCRLIWETRKAVPAPAWLCEKRLLNRNRPASLTSFGRYRARDLKVTTRSSSLFHLKPRKKSHRTTRHRPRARSA